MSIIFYLNKTKRKIAISKPTEAVISEPPKMVINAQIAYEKAIQATKSAIDDLKAQLAAPSLDKKIIEAQQDNLAEIRF